MDSPSAWQGWWPRAASSMALLRAHGWRKIDAALRLKARDATPMISLSPSPSAVGKAQTTSGQLLEHRIDIAAGHRAGSTRPSGQCGRPRRPDLDEDPSPPGRCRASGRSFCPNGARSQHSTTSVLRPSRLSHPGRVGSDTRPSPLGAVPAGRAASKGRNVDPIAPPVPTDERTSRWQALRSPALATLVVFLALAVWHFRLTWTAPRGATIGGHGDPWLFVWFLKSDQLAVTHAHSPLFSHELNVPGGVNLTWNTSVILPGVLLAGVTAWLGPVFTYNLLVTLALPLSAWAASLVFRRYV